MWAGGDLNETISYSTDYITGHTIQLQSSKQYSSNGDYSLKLNAEEEAWLRFRLSISPEDVHKTITVHAKVYSPNSNMRSHLLFQDTNTESIRTIEVNIVQNNYFTLISISNEIPENTAYSFFNFALTEPAFIDELYYEIQ